jgi:hypothetical protein
LPWQCKAFTPGPPPQSPWFLSSPLAYLDPVDWAMGEGLAPMPVREAKGSSRPGSDAADALRDAAADAAADAGAPVPRIGLAPTEGGSARGEDAAGPGPPLLPGRCCADAAFCAAMLRCGLKPSCCCSRSSRSMPVTAPGRAERRGGPGRGAAGQEERRDTAAGDDRLLTVGYHEQRSSLPDQECNAYARGRDMWAGVCLAVPAVPACRVPQSHMDP